MRPKITISLMVMVSLILSGCTGGGGRQGGYYRHHYGPNPWFYRGGYVRDRVHVVSDSEIRALESVESAHMPPASEPMPDMGFGDMDMDIGGDIDF